MLVLKAINDTQLPKFITQDIPLFEGITNDLFPYVVLQDHKYGHLSQSIDDCFHLKNLVYKQEFKKKILQIYDTMAVRHGLMVVGKAMGGKSTAIEVLRQAIEMSNKSTDE